MGHTGFFLCIYIKKKKIEDLDLNQIFKIYLNQIFFFSLSPFISIKIAII